MKDRREGIPDSMITGAMLGTLFFAIALAFAAIVVRAVSPAQATTYTVLAGLVLGTRSRSASSR
ncbi:hypothetical protein [Haloarchaeobius sp. TZWWS8]|uniref:hypothetical protein n=1 Tax=Haloarchaeobius sp. TZWWS8 TaxID=3446121 RepID=UPI003EB70016